MSTSHNRSQPTAERPGQVPWTRGNRVLGWDPARRRMWLGGQRLHHGATGLALAAAGALELSRHRGGRRALASALAGGALVAHDWKDRTAWFAGGLQSD